ncbi:MAG: hypothetical protein M3214_05305 [Actinomycetota bacterium]|nr:hypothetical protein [Actinomycetota bacterium]
MERDLRQMLLRKAQEVSDDATIPPRVVGRARAQRVLTAAVASVIVVTASFGTVAAFRAGFDDDIRPISSPPPSVEADEQGFVAVHRQLLVGGTHKLWVREEGDALCVRHTFPGDEFRSRDCGPIPDSPNRANVMSFRVGDQVVVVLQAPSDLQRASVDLKGGGRMEMVGVDLPPELEGVVGVVTTTLPGDSIGCVEAHFPGGVVRKEPLLQDGGKQFQDTSEDEALARAGCL